jgi:2-(1,2-epoxy-1,2-dihydrophenyl)acetyl-CoA isomerase
MTHFKTITYAVEDGLAVISLNRPDKRNAMNVEMFTELGDAAEQAGSDPEIRAVLVRGEGPSFCAGIDLTVLGTLAGAVVDRFRGFGQMAQRPFRLLATLDKPTVAAVQGHALGAGFQLALACDVRIAAMDATFGLLEARYGLVPDLGGLYHLAREVGPARAKELAWSARRVDADEAERLGLVSRVVAAATLDADARAFAAEITAHSPVTASLVKDLVAQAGARTLDAEMERELDAQANALASQDHAEAVAAFLERRPPHFVGK